MASTCGPFCCSSQLPWTNYDQRDEGFDHYGYVKSQRQAGYALRDANAVCPLFIVIRRMLFHFLISCSTAERYHARVDEFRSDVLAPFWLREEGEKPLGMKWFLISLPDETQKRPNHRQIRLLKLVNFNNAKLTLALWFETYLWLYMAKKSWMPFSCSLNLHICEIWTRSIHSWGWLRDVIKTLSLWFLFLPPSGTQNIVIWAFAWKNKNRTSRKHEIK